MVGYTKGVYVRPKRRIEKSVSLLMRNVSVALTGAVLFTAEDRKTLVRTIVDLKFDTVGDGASAQLGATLAIAPNAIDVIEADVAEDLSRELPFQELNRVLWAHDMPLDAHYVYEWKFDSKGMRKLNTGDRIRLYTVCTTANMFFLSGTVVFMFKE